MTDAELKNIEEIAGYFFSPEETAVICELKPEAIRREDFKLAHKKGRLKREYELRKSILELAVNGSSPAQMLAVQIMDKSQLDNIET